jgi:hypothetical protein
MDGRRSTTRSRMRRGPSETGVVAGVAFALALVGALALTVGSAVGFLTPETEAVFTLTGIVGWLLITGSTILAFIVAVRLICTAIAGPRVPVSDWLLLAAAVATISLAVVTNPLMGSGSGTG